MAERGRGRGGGRLSRGGGSSERGDLPGGRGPGGPPSGRPAQKRKFEEFGQDWSEMSPEEQREQNLATSHLAIMTGYDSRSRNARGRQGSAKQSIKDSLKSLAALGFSEETVKQMYGLSAVPVTQEEVEAILQFRPGQDAPRSSGTVVPKITGNPGEVSSEEERAKVLAAAKGLDVMDIDSENMAGGAGKG